MADKKNPRDEALADSRKRVEDETKEQRARIDSVQPTPTQEENDRARLGIESAKDLDNKEADGSEEAPANPPKR